MSRRVVIVLCASCATILVCFGTSTAGAAPQAASSTDTAASVNATPNGVWSTAALATAHGSQVVGPADSFGCPSLWGCGWVNSGFGGNMGKWQDQNAHMSDFHQIQCTTGDSNETWNDCISSIDNNKGSGCRFTWFWDGSYGGNSYQDPDGVAFNELGNSNDQFSSDKSCD
jgi:hypothetical protein